MIIIEGPDGAGKSTLARKLSKDLGLPIRDWKMPRDDMPNRGVRERVYTSIADAVRLRAGDPVYIHDRLYYSEIVYGEVLRGKVAFPQSERTNIRKMMEALHTPIIFCLPQFEVVEANVKSSQQLEEVPEFIEEIYKLYSRVYSKLRIHSAHRVRRYDYTGQVQPSGSYDGIIAMCKKYLERRERMLWQSSDSTRTS